jgi:hypothetical protein
VEQATAKYHLKQVLGRIPLLPEIYQKWWAGDRPPSVGYRAERLSQVLNGWVAAASQYRERRLSRQVKRVLIFGYLPWWLEYTCALATLMAAQGNVVELAFLPYRRWMNPVSLFDIRRQRTLLKQSLNPLESVLKLHDLTTIATSKLPEKLTHQIKFQSEIDVQYTLQREDINLSIPGEAKDLYRVRLARNQVAAAASLTLFQQNEFDVVIVPNGSILEFGVVYRVAKYLNIPTVTFEFGEQRQRLWLAQDGEVMRLDTSDVWQARGGIPLVEKEIESLSHLYQARRGGRLWHNFARQWQPKASNGVQGVCQQLGLDRGRPIVLLCTNVVGDSLALNRQIFTQGMADWLENTVLHFAQRPEAQLVVRVHPGEMLGAGHPSVDIIRTAIPDQPPHVITVVPDAEVNTYDLIEVAHLGLVYTTTVGMEMAMAGVPVVVSGKTHYRGKGFTHDPETLADYFSIIDRRIAEPLDSRLSREKVELAVRYAYRFFFEYPFPFPWHLVSFWDDLSAHPLEQIATPEGLKPYERTVDAFLGEPIDWITRASTKMERELA